MTNEELFEKLMAAVERGRRLHPGFAEGPYQALGYLSEEHGEVTKAITKKEGWERVLSELIDLMAVAWRFAMREHEHEKACDCDECKLPCEGCASGHFQNGNNQSEGRK